MTIEELTHLIDKCMANSIYDQLIVIDEKGKKVLRKVALERMKVLRKKLDWRDEFREENMCLYSAELAVFMLCSWSDVKRIRINHYGEKSIERFSRFISESWPDWAEKWILQEIESMGEWVNNSIWPVCRRAIAEGKMEKPDLTGYYRLALLNILPAYRREHENPYTAFVNNPDLLEYEFWKFFEHDVQAFHTYSMDELDERSLCFVVKKLAAEGKIDRDRLLKATLGALHNPFPQEQLRHFHVFHDYLEPTKEEQINFKDIYIELLSSPIVHILAFALRNLKAIQKEGCLSIDDIAEHIAPVFSLSQKTHIKTATQIIDALLKKKPEAFATIGPVCIHALSHESADIQLLILKLLIKYKKQLTAEIAESMYEMNDLINPSNLELFRELIKEITPELEINNDEISRDSVFDEAEFLSHLESVSPEYKELLSIEIGQVKSLEDLAPLSFSPMAIPQLNNANELNPIASIDELIDRASAFIHDAKSSLEYELIIDAVIRFVDTKPNDFEAITAPFVKDLLNPNQFSEASNSFMYDSMKTIFVAWIKPKIKPYEFRSNSQIMHFLNIRTKELKERILIENKLPILSCPTHDNGLIKPLVLLERYKQWEGEKIDKADFILALLRLAPDNRKDCLTLLQVLHQTDYRDALIYACGGELSEEIKDVDILIAASRSKDPMSDDSLLANRKRKKLFGLFSVDHNHGPDAFTVGRAIPKVDLKKINSWSDAYRIFYYTIEPEMPKRIPGYQATVLLNKAGRWERPRDINFYSFICPLYSSITARFNNSVSGSVDDDSGAWETGYGSLEIFNRPDICINKDSAMLIIFALANKGQEIRGLIIDQLIEMIDDGRIIGIELSNALHFLHQNQLLKLNRLCDALKEVARCSILHQSVCSVMLECLYIRMTEKPKDIHNLLSLLLELNIDLKKSVKDETSTKLESFKGASKAAKAAKKLLEIKETDPSVQKHVFYEAMSRRVDRALSYQN
ncbi:MAG: hypothetical protein HRT89_19890 [Lentisphaeria bacterium]|nr:DUF6493 family protein [Lentisphaeria bacterium]NQZ70320.1 hypothetical protein [Lentisphaeria bacterium]